MWKWANRAEVGPVPRVGKTGVAVVPFVEQLPVYQVSHWLRSVRLNKSATGRSKPRNKQVP